MLKRTYYVVSPPRSYLLGLNDRYPKSVKDLVNNLKYRVIHTVGQRAIRGHMAVVHVVAGGLKILNGIVDPAGGVHIVTGDNTSTVTHGRRVNMDVVGQHSDNDTNNVSSHVLNTEGVGYGDLGTVDGELVANVHGGQLGLIGHDGLL